MLPLSSEFSHFSSHLILLSAHLDHNFPIYIQFCDSVICIEEYCEKLWKSWLTLINNIYCFPLTTNFLSFCDGLRLNVCVWIHNGTLPAQFVLQQWKGINKHLLQKMTEKEKATQSLISLRRNANSFERLVPGI